MCNLAMSSSTSFSQASTFMSGRGRGDARDAVYGARVGTGHKENLTRSSNIEL